MAWDRLKFMTSLGAEVDCVNANAGDKVSTKMGNIFLSIRLLIYDIDE